MSKKSMNMLLLLGGGAALLYFMSKGSASASTAQGPLAQLYSGATNLYNQYLGSGSGSSGLLGLGRRRAWR